jgi:hypothetical protein
VIYEKHNKELPKPLEHFARGLLATTCLTVACGATAMASTVTEGSPPGTAPYFPTTPNGYLLPVGTNEVIGVLGLVGETGDFGPTSWFEFQGLTPGGSYSLSAFTEAGDFVRLSFFNDSMPSALGGLDPGEKGGTDSTTLTAPADGNLVVNMYSIDEGGGQAFQVNIAANRVETGPVEGGSTVPEPSTMGGVGLGLGALALAWHRRRPQ